MKSYSHKGEEREILKENEAICIGPVFVNALYLVLLTP
jgi:hypothetical protein